MDPSYSDIQYNGVMQYRRGYKRSRKDNGAPALAEDLVLREVCKYPVAMRKSMIKQIRREIMNGTYFKREEDSGEPGKARECSENRKRRRGKRVEKVESRKKAQDVREHR